MYVQSLCSIHWLYYLCIGKCVKYDIMQPLCFLNWLLFFMKCLCICRQYVIHLLQKTLLELVTLTLATRNYHKKKLHTSLHTYGQYCEKYFHDITPIDSNPAIAAPAVFPQSCHSRLEKMADFSIFPHIFPIKKKTPETINRV